MTVLFNTRGIRKPSSRDMLRGAGSILNTSGKTKREYDFANDDAEADIAALANDWNAIGEDLTQAVTQYHRNGG